MKKLQTRKNGERGIAVMFTALSLLSIIPLVGLAVDAGILYTVKGKLQMAVDAAALAGARALSRGNDDASQQSAAIDTAKEYALLNFPNGYFNISPPSFTTGDISVDETVTNQRSVTVNAHVSAPLYFLRWLGDTATTVAATATAVRRDVNVVIVMDRSTSLQDSGSCDPLQAAAIGFLANFANGRDNVGLVTFATSSLVDFPIANNFNTASPNVSTIINNLVCAGFTSTAQGLWQGYSELARLNQPNALNVILLFTDGYPTGMKATFPIKSTSTCSSKTAKTAVIAADPGYGIYTSGLFTDVAQAQPYSNDFNAGPAGNYTNCYYASNLLGSSPTVGVVQDVQYVPATDYWGNNAKSGYQSVTSSGSNIATERDSVVNAAWNAADSAGLRIRHGASITLPAVYSGIQHVTTFTIGLGNSGAGVPTDFLERVANDPRATNYDSSYPAGLYAYAPQPADLTNAFSRIASEILHLSK